MNVLIDCEKSGKVREEFRRLGHNAWSCDLEPASDGSPFHIRADAIVALKCGPQLAGSAWPWDLVIAHPPCTYLSNSGVLRLYKGGKKVNGIDPVRWAKMEDGAKFFRAFWSEYKGPLCVENPVMHGHARKLIGLPNAVRQTVQPYDFGDDASKATVLWLRGLPGLRIDPRQRCNGRMVHVPSRGHVERWANQTDSGQNKLPPSADRAAKRAVTYAGIARAMAEQWSAFLAPGLHLTATQSIAATHGPKLNELW